MTVDELARVLEEALPDRVSRDVSSVPFTTYRCGGSFAVVVRAENEDELARAGAVFAGAPEIEVLVVGRGSNMLISDDGFSGVAVTLAGEFDELHIEAGDNPRVDAGAAVALPVLARRSAGAGVAGLEFFVGIPGSVGGAVRMNAGGHGSDVATVIDWARVLDLDDGVVQPRVGATELGFGYRSSALGPRAVVVGARFRGALDDPVAAGARIDEIVRWRREHQPGGQNAGSVFTNPPGDAAGRLIEACGCKGLRIGGAVVSEKHANFFVADPGARAADVYALVREVRQRVEDQTGVRLHPELRFVGFECEEAR